MLFLVQLRHNAGLLSAVAWVVALVCALALGVSGYLSFQSTLGVRAALAERSGADVAFRPALQLADNAERQDEQVRAAIRSTFDPSGVSTTVTRTLDSHVTLLTDPGGEFALNAGALAMSVPDFGDLAQLVDGRFADGVTEVTVQAVAAELLGLTPGDEVLLQGERFTVAGTWLPIDHLDPRWYGDPIIDEGIDNDYGPFVIDEAAWSRLDAAPDVRWTVVPDVAQIDAASLAQMTQAWSQIQETWRAQVDDIRTLEIHGRFVQTARELSVWITGLSAIEPVIILVLLAIALVALWELARTSAVSRRNDTALIWSRGSSALAVARSAALETAVAALIGAVVGAAVALGALAVLLGFDVAALRETVVDMWVPLVAVVLAACAFAAVHAHRTAHRDSAPDRTGAARRASRAAGLGSVALVLLAAGLSVWQLRLYGTPLTPRADGPESPDPIAVVAPALALAAGALLAVLAFSAFARALDRASRGARPVPYLAARSLRSGVGIAAAQVVVVALAAGTTLLAASYSATWSQSFAQTSALHAGSDLYLSSRVQGIAADALDEATNDGERIAAPLEIQPLTLGSESGRIVGVTPQALDDLALDAGGVFDAVAVGDAIRTDVPGTDIPGSATSLTLEAEVDGVSDGLGVHVRVVDGYGVLRDIQLPAVAEAQAPGVRTYSADLPAALLAAPGPWRVVAMDFVFPNGSVDATAKVSVTRLSADGTELPLGGFWIPDSPGALMDAPLTDGSGHGFTAETGADLVRLTGSFDDAPSDSFQPRVVISQRLAELVGLEVGDIVGFTLQDSIERLNAIVVLVVPVIPSSPTEVALMMDLGVIQHHQLRVTAEPAAPRDLWVSTQDPVATAEAMRPFLPANITVDAAKDDASRSVLGSAAIALWAGAAMCIVMATIAVATTTRAQSRSRRMDSGVLRALGLFSREQAAMRFRELAVTIGIAALAGAVIGVAVSALTVPELARAAIPLPYRALGTSFAVDAAPLALALLTLLGALVVVALAARHRARVLARRAIPSEGTS